MENKVFKSLNRRFLIKKFLKNKESMTLTELKDGLQNEENFISFFEIEDAEIVRWLDTISGISRMNCDGKIKYYVSDAEPRLNVKRKCVSPLASESQTPKRQMINRHSAVSSSQEAREDIQNKPRSLKQTNPSKRNIQSRRLLEEFEDPNIFDLPLFGDDQMLNIALFDLKFTKDPNYRKRQSGNCISGLRINEATRRLQNLSSNVKRIIVNVGSVDIAENRPLIEMIRDIKNFVNACEERGIRPILTTLAPLPNYHSDSFIEVFKGFNDFILKHLSLRFSVIDLHDCMLTTKGYINTNFYQFKSRHISGSKKCFVMWNSYGRQQILNRLVKKLGNAIVYEDDEIVKMF